MKALRILLLSVMLLAVAFLLPTPAAQAATTLVYTGTLDFIANPFDDYAVFIPAGTNITATLDCGPPKPGTLDPYLEVRDPDGMLLTPLDLSGAATYDDGIGDGMCGDGYSGGYYTFVAAKTGNYVFRATSYDYVDSGGGEGEGGEGYGTGDGPYTLTVEGLPEPTGWDPGDDRINPHPAQPVALYCRTEGVVGYSPDGALVLFASQEQIDAVGVPAAPALLANSADGSARLYRLPSGEFQLNVNQGAQEYVFTWDACPPSHKTTQVIDLATGQTLVYYTWP